MFDVFLAGMLAWMTPSSEEGPFLHWKQKLDPGMSLGAEYSAALVHNDIVYVGTSTSPGVKVLERSSGSHIGEIATNAAVQAVPAMNEGIMYVADIAGTVYAYDINKQETIWEKKTNTPIMSELIIVEESIVFTNVNNTIYRLSLDGGLLWRYQYEPSVSRAKELNIFGSSSPYIDSDSLIVGFSDGAVEKLSLDTGTPQKKVWIGAGRYPDIVSKIAATDSVIIISGFEGPTVAMSKELDVEIWRRDIGRASDILLRDETLYIAQSDGELSALDVQTGAVLWSWDSERNTNLTSPLFHNEHIFVGSVEGSIYKIDAKTGEMRWKYEAEHSLMGFTAPITIDDEQLLVLGNDRVLYSFSLMENAHRKRRVQPKMNNHMFFPVLGE